MRTQLDFSNHKLTVVNDTLTTIHELKLPDSAIKRFKFVNTCNRLMVLSDYGDWLFCQSFIPSYGSKVSDGYWAQKTVINSTQSPYEFDEDMTLDELDNLILNCATDDKNYLTFLTEAKQMLFEYGEEEYKNFVYQNAPPSWDSESTPYCKKIKYSLQVIFDAFEEVSKRL